MPPYRLLTPEELAAIASEHGINSENVRWGLTDPQRSYLAIIFKMYRDILVSILSTRMFSKIVTRSLKKKAGNHHVKWICIEKRNVSRRDK